MITYQLHSFIPISSPTPQSDIALEGELLSSLVHPNIIKLRGISYGGATGFEKGPRCVLPPYPFSSTLCRFRRSAQDLSLWMSSCSCSGYYLIIDRLCEILDQRIERWHSPTRPKEHGTMTLFSSLTKRSNTTDRADCNIVLDEQLDVG